MDLSSETRIAVRHVITSYSIHYTKLYDLLAVAVGILQLQERRRVALFLREDDFQRFISCLVYIPRDRFDTPLRLAIQEILAQAFDGEILAYYTQVAESPLARLHVIVRTRPGDVPAYDARERNNFV